MTLPESRTRKSDSPVAAVLGAISFSHMLNDMMQSLILAIYPILQGRFALSLLQIGLITLVFQLAGSIFQPVVGYVTDRKPMPYSLSVGMVFTFSGLLLLANAPNYVSLLIAAGLVGMGSSIFHPESSRVARMASGTRPGLAQSVFMVGGNVGTAIGPLLAAWVVLEHGLGSVAWFSLAAMLAFVVLLQVGRWYAKNHATRGKAHLKQRPANPPSTAQVAIALAVLCTLIFSKFFYLASIKNFYTFYLMQTFGVSTGASEILLFVFLASVACGVMIGGPIGDRVGRKAVIWVSILGVAPFTLALPYANLLWTGILSVFIGLILASAFPAIIVYAQELLPKRIGMVSGLFYGLGFGMGGIGAAALGQLADVKSVDYVYQICAYLPLLGVFAIFLPNLRSNMGSR
jgi:FSR family fosmidomycin resistance protein-like MFS transporter